MALAGSWGPLSCYSPCDTGMPAAGTSEKGICQLVPGARQGASGKARLWAPVIPKPACQCALQSGLCVHDEAPQLGSNDSSAGLILCPVPT